MAGHRADACPAWRGHHRRGMSGDLAGPRRCASEAVPSGPRSRQQGAAGRFVDEAVKFHHLSESQIPHQARRRYNSSFFRSTRSAAALKSSSRFASRSARAARARSSGASPSRAAASRSRSAWADERSMVSLMRILYCVDALPNKTRNRPAFCGRIDRARRISRGPVAQWIEQGTPKPLVGGSIPSGPAS